MKCLDLTLPEPAANLALDEALLDACEEGGDEALRFWEPQHYFVVVGYSNHVATEVNVAACRRERIGIYRRCSGGGTVLQGPGCLNYTLVIRIDGNDAVQNITSANQHIMGHHRSAMSALAGRPVRLAGHTDLSLGGLKFSGNAQRRKRHALIFHGTFLLNFDLTLIEKLLPMPSRQPDYRENRPHGQFVMNLGLPADSVKTILRLTWSAYEPLKIVPDYKTLLAEKYSRDDWNWKL